MPRPEPALQDDDIRFFTDLTSQRGQSWYGSRRPVMKNQLGQASVLTNAELVLWLKCRSKTLKTGKIKDAGGGKKALY